MDHRNDLLAAADLEALVDALTQRLDACLSSTRSGDRWLNSAEAAAYLGLSVTALHKLTSARAVPFSQDCPGGKCWFQRSALDAWRMERS